jgi:NADPH:quinone reductase-like Zn-dependent oxidoreductase
LKIEPNDIYSSLHKPIHKYNSRAAIRHLIRRLPAWVLCEGVALVNIVRKQEQVDLLTKLGAKFVVNSSSESFKKDLYKAIDATGATLAFDAIGGGELAGDIQATMEAVGSKEATGFNTYGSVDNKQVYIYGGLDFLPTLLNRAFGMTWDQGVRVLDRKSS